MYSCCIDRGSELAYNFKHYFCVMKTKNHLCVIRIKFGNSRGIMGEWCEMHHGEDWGKFIKIIILLVMCSLIIWLPTYKENRA